jgi:hypothetical protein
MAESREALDLLKREIERGRQGSLVHAKQPTPRADALADMHVDRVRDTVAATYRFR